MDDVCYFIWAVKFIIAIFGFTLHLMGIYSLRKYQSKYKRRPRENKSQQLILMNLSIVEMLSLIQGTANDVVFITYKSIGASTNVTAVNTTIFDILPTDFHHYMTSTYVILSAEFLLAMFIIIYDRLRCVLSPIEYHVKMTPSTLKRMIVISWFLSLIPGIVKIRTRLHYKENIFHHLGASLLCISIILSIVTYTIIGIRIKRSRELLRKADVLYAARETRKLRKEYLVPGLIIFCTILFFAMPYHLMNYLAEPVKTRKKYILWESMNIIICIGFTLDPIIYIFLTKHFRKIIMEKFFPCRRRLVVNVSTVGKGVITMACRNLSNNDTFSNETNNETLHRTK